MTDPFYGQRFAAPGMTAHKLINFPFKLGKFTFCRFQESVNILKWFD